LSRDEGIALYRAILPECEKEGNKYMENIKEIFIFLFSNKRNEGYVIVSNVDSKQGLHLQPENIIIKYMK
jgi:hypothetical protein